LADFTFSKTKVVPRLPYFLGQNSGDWLAVRVLVFVFQFLFASIRWLAEKQVCHLRPFCAPAKMN